MDDREIFNIEGYSVSKVPHGTYLVIIAIIKMVKTKLMFELVTVISNRVPLTLQWYIIYKTLVMVILYPFHDNFHINCNDNGVLVYYGDGAFDGGNGADGDVDDGVDYDTDGDDAGYVVDDGADVDADDAGYVVDNGGADIGIKPFHRLGIAS